MAKLGYARVAAGSDALEEQVDALKEFGCKKIFTDDKTTKNTYKDGLNAMLEYAREGDIVVVLKLDRLARSIQELQQIIDDLKVREIDIVSITQNINTTTDHGNDIYSWIDIFADFERELHSERIKLGIENAREKGVKLGRNEASRSMKEKAFEMYQSEEHTMREIVEETGLSRATIYRYIERKKGTE
ncbi:recombinase family protein [Pseudalkalibacillus sp. Hm43]|uniref:recombinase family protein n=1 Tax=Pseudalkalibacillus sp. Hm43 TaxID=3450742 RepID=UPI003F421E64